MTLKSSRRHAFTRIELLVVIAVTAILTASLLPALRLAKAGKRTEAWIAMLAITTRNSMRVNAR
jgi:prepilin-type N-terminal cleavage/methylation domain-containing protein